MAAPKKPSSDSGDTSAPSTDPYLVLARKYRPLDFSDLIGQDAMVQTLANAISTGRIHHAFILTGVRGVGKTTTARILARAFNYVGKDGAKPTLELAVYGEHCQAIIEGRHVDVMEMDAASNTGIDDIREIIDSVKYGPVSAPYKIYIIDEVHMLSKQAFNGLLKTLEEPPPYVKFIFATTEIRKVPVTILSRCQRFDLRRIPSDLMTAYLTDLLAREEIEGEADALSMIVRAGEGSARDCLSLLDQAIAHGNGVVTAQNVQTMLGLADRGQVIDLFSALLSGKVDEALALTRSLYDGGTEPQTIIADLAALTHLVTRIKAVPQSVDDPALTPDEKKRGAELASQLGMRVLTRTWQILQTGFKEVASAGNGIQAAEMVLIRLAYAADLPTPDELIEKLTGPGATTGQAAVPNRAGRARSAPVPSGQGSSGQVTSSGVNLQAIAGGRAQTATMPQFMPESATNPEQARVAKPLDDPQNFEQLVELAAKRRDLVIKNALESSIRPISFEPGRMDIGLVDNVDPAIVSTLSARLKDWTGKTWLISVANGHDGIQTVREKTKAADAALEAEAEQDPMVQAVLETFPNSRVVNIQVLQTAETAGIEYEELTPEEDDRDNQQ